MRIALIVLIAIAVTLVGCSPSEHGPDAGDAGAPDVPLQIDAADVVLASDVSSEIAPTDVAADRVSVDAPEASRPDVLVDVSRDVDPLCPDLDGDRRGAGEGCFGPSDCNDADPTIYPGAGEHCNGIDDNCDGRVDDGPYPESWCRMNAPSAPFAVAGPACIQPSARMPPYILLTETVCQVCAPLDSDAGRVHCFCYSQTRTPWDCGRSYPPG